MIDVNKAIASAAKTGKVTYGTRNAIKSAKLGKARLILVASNCERTAMDDITYYAKLSGVPLAIYKGTRIDLGVTCSKPFMVSALSIREPGDSEILKLAQESKESAEEAETTSEETDA
jgi:large subunit ribosomal protein L30e